MTFSAPNDPEVTTIKGTWSLTGDQLKSTLEPKYNPQKMTTTATVSVNGNTMVTTAVMLPPARITKTISTGTRM
jgi:peptide subunit release factor 1 (eRF1)